MDDSTDAGLAARRRRRRQRELDAAEKERRARDEARERRNKPDPLEATLPFVVMSMLVGGAYQTEAGYKLLRPAAPLMMLFFLLPPLFVGLVYVAEWVYNWRGSSEEDDIEDMLSEEEEELLEEEDEEDEGGAGGLPLVEEEREEEATAQAQSGA